MQRWILVAAAVMVCLVGVLPAVGQDTVSEYCTAEVAVQIQDAVEEAVAQARTALDAGDVPGWHKAMQLSRNMTAILDGLCSNYVFTGEGSKVLGPVVFMDGVYKASLTMNGMGGMGFEEIGGDCDFVPSMTISDMNGGTDEDAYTFIGCETLIEVRGSSAQWTLAFELVAPME